MDDNLRALVEESDLDIVRALATLADATHPAHSKALGQICRDLRDVSAQMSELLAKL